MYQNTDLRHINGIVDIVDQYDVFFCDLLGSIGTTAGLYRYAVECIRTLVSMGKRIVILTNMPSSHKMASSLVGEYGLSDDERVRLVTAGQVLIDYINAQKLERFGNKVYVLGDRYLTDEMHSVQVVDKVKDADMILLTKNFRIENMYHFLMAAIEKNLPVLCCSQYVSFALCNGDWRQSPSYVLKQYRNLGGDVFLFGKPEKIFYEYVFNRYPDLKGASIVCIGDTLVTDILGANRIGLDSVWITGGEFSRYNYSEMSNNSAKSCMPTYSSLCFRY